MSSLEDLLALHIKQTRLPNPVREFSAIPERRFRWDFAWPDRRLLVEVQGGTWAKGPTLQAKASNGTSKNLTLQRFMIGIYSNSQATTSARASPWSRCKNGSTRQGASCAICKSTEPCMKNAGRLYVDHCHETGEVRGLLCFRCNTMLGNAGDSPEVLRLAAEYLENGL